MSQDFPDVAHSQQLDLDLVVADLSAAFADYPLCRWILRGSGHEDLARRKLLELLLCEMGYAFGHVYRHLSGGTAVWMASEHLPQFDMLRAIVMIRKLLSIGGVSCVRRCLATHRRMQAFHARSLHLYLFLIGVQPQVQRRGIGTQLITEGLRWADRDHRGVFVETSRESTLGFYRRFGFEVADVYDIEPGSPATWTLWRPAR
jgi:ribosomal protein S18 acetylase RimI-like enzyme